MITNITLENFKCFRRVSIDPKLITVFIGPNGTGKSGVLQALLLLKQSRDNVDPLQLDGELVKFEPEAFMFQRPNPELDTVGFSLAGHWCVGAENRVEFETQLSYSSGARLRNQRGKTAVSVEGQLVEIPPSRTTIPPIVNTPRGAISFGQKPGINSFTVNSTSGQESQYLPFWQSVSRGPSDLLANMKVVPSARGLTLGRYSLGPSTADDISNTKGLGQQEQDIATTLAYSRREVEKVSLLMKRVTGVGFRTDTVPPQSAKPVSESPAGDFSLVMEGFGTNALVQLLFEVVRAVSGATVLIEEPEVHLHPKAQRRTGVGDGEKGQRPPASR